MKSRHLVVVPHTHWDREWYMPFEEFRKRLVAMMDRLLRTLESDSDFRYFELDGQTIVLSDYLEIRPDQEKKLKKLIRQGRIRIGPWYVQPDEFLVSGEALIRNLRRGIRHAREFGKPSMVGYLPDQFGHIAQMPQILAGFGVRSAVVWRGVGDSVDQSQFLWESPDGTRLFTVYLADSYGNGAFLPLEPAKLRSRLLDLITRQEGYSIIRSLLIMNGLDHLEPQDGLPIALEKAVSEMEGVTCEMGNLEVYIRQAREQANALPTHRGEFRSSQRAPLIPNVASARIAQKQRDFENCRLLEKYVEPLCAWAELLGDTRPYRGFIDYAWRITLNNHPHDSICGCSVDAVHREMETRFDKARQVGETLRNDALSFLASHSDSSCLPADEPVLCVYNPLSARTHVIDVVADLKDPDMARSVRDAGGRILALQKQAGERELFIAMQDSAESIRAMVAGIESRELLGLYINDIFWRREGKTLKLTLIMGRAETGEVDFEQRRAQLLEVLSDPSVETVDVKGVAGARTRLSFCADDLSPAGLTLFSLSSAESLPHEAEKMLTVSPDIIENDFYLVTIRRDGVIDILDKQSDMKFPRCLQFIDEGDRGDSYTFDEVPGSKPIDSSSSAADVSIEETGPVRASVRIEIRLNIPEKLVESRDARYENQVSNRIITYVSLYRSLKRIDFRTEVNNQCEDHRLRVRFNAPFAAPVAHVESAFATVIRPSKVEEFGNHFEKPTGTGPQKTFSCVENGNYGMALFNRGIPEIEPLAEENSTSLFLTLIRSVGWLSRDDLVARPAAAGPQLPALGAQSKGRHTFEYAFTSYEGNYVDADIVNQAHAYAFPPIATITNRHEGALMSGTSLATSSNPAVIISALEKPGPGKTYSVRLYNITDKGQKTNVAFWGKNATACEVDLLGRQSKRKRPLMEGDKMQVSFRRAEIKTFHVMLGQ